jgi:hypothetical protein
MELQELCKDLVIEVDIKQERLEWFGHLVRMNHGRVVKKKFGAQTGGRKKGKI